MFESLLKKLARALEQAGIAYMVIGGQAVLLYGETRLTKDIDVTVGLAPDQLQQLLDIVESSGWRILVKDPHAFVRETMVLQWHPHGFYSGHLKL